MNLQENRAHVQKLLKRATKRDLIEAARRSHQHWAACCRQGVIGEDWRAVFIDSLHMTLVDKRQKGKESSGVDSHEGESHNYAGHYSRFYVAS
jgi:hypothetical protein